MLNKILNFFIVFIDWKINKNIILVINAPAVFNVPWLEKVKGLIFSGFPYAESAML